MEPATGLDPVGRHEVMTWCEANGLHYIFGLSSNVVLEQMVEPLADAVRAQCAEAQAKLVALRRSEPPVDAGWLRRAEAQANDPVVLIANESRSGLQRAMT
jgi:hypothetical protein